MDLFVAGLTHVEPNNLNKFGFHRGSLPVRYLELPLMHRKVRKID